MKKHEHIYNKDSQKFYLIHDKEHYYKQCIKCKYWIRIKLKRCNHKKAYAQWIKFNYGNLPVKGNAIKVCCQKCGEEL
jgi:hypothetical protein